MLFHLLPGDPARMMLGQRADIASVEAINKDLGLDRPLIIQYLGFLNDVAPFSSSPQQPIEMCCTSWLLRSCSDPATVSSASHFPSQVSKSRTASAAVRPSSLYPCDRFHL
jgi:hypothetical protein